MSASSPHPVPDKANPGAVIPPPSLQSAPASNLDRLRKRLGKIKRPTDLPNPADQELPLPAQQNQDPNSRPGESPSEVNPQINEHKTATRLHRPRQFKKYLPLIGQAALAIGALILTTAIGFFTGLEIGKTTLVPSHASSRPAGPQTRTLSVSEREALEAAAALIGQNQSRAALKKLEALREASPQLPYLDYLEALAALQEENFPLAARLAASSAAKGERVSDALALQAAAMDGNSANGPILGDPLLTQKALLESAIAADPLNPRPRLDLANLLRKQGQPEKAIPHLLAAKYASTPVDSILAIEFTLALARIEGGLAPDSQEKGSALDIFLQAFRAAQHGRQEEAAQLLRNLRPLLPETTWHYLVTDPACRRAGMTPAPQLSLSKYLPEAPAAPGKCRWQRIVCC